MHRLRAALALAALAVTACETVPTATLLPDRAALAEGAESGTVVVTEEDIVRQPENTPPTNEWVLYTRLAGNAAFRTGPGTPPSGVGSLEMVTPTGADKVTLFNYEHVGTPLADIDAMSYATYRTSGAVANQLPAINIQVDVNGDAPGGFTTLVFEPVYNTDQGAIQEGVWQEWDAYAGGEAIWWSSNPIPGAPNRDTFVSWSTIVAANPDAVIVGGYGVNQGSGNPALIAAADVLTLGYGDTLVTYDFEPFRTPATADSCKHGGWQTLRRGDGTTFKNQGQCVSYANTGK